MISTVHPTATESSEFVGLTAPVLRSILSPDPDNPYDQVPYKSFPYAQSHPERLATIAALFGLRTRPLENCRVLELGCSSGGNLVPLAEQFPGSEFVGIDASARQIHEGQLDLGKLRLPNVRLEQRDIAEIDPAFGEFDYVICHGVFSWVPREIQDAILRVCSENLSPDGVAYVSYNTLPGWHMRGMIRDMMCYHAGAEDPEGRVAKARGLLELMTQCVPAEDNAFGTLLKKETEALRDKDDHYVFHEHLERVNDPVYFHQFMDRARAAGLQYLGEADFSVMSPQNLPQQAQTLLHNFSGDVVKLEQYMDFFRNRMFRQTILCHQHATLDRSVPQERVLGMHVASPVKPETPVVDVQSTAPASFRGPHAVTTTTEPLVKAALLHLGQIWPASVAFPELLAVARSRLAGDAVVVDTAHLAQDARKLAAPMIRCYATSQIELSVQPRRFTLDVGERPKAPSFARLQAESSNRVTNLRHETVHLTDLNRHVLRRLDGDHGRDALLQWIVDLADAGALLVHENGQKVSGVDRLRDALRSPLQQSLTQLARHGLLVPPKAE